MFTAADGTAKRRFYGDGIFNCEASGPHITASFTGVGRDSPYAKYNRQMSRLRVTVEWGFGKIKGQFPAVASGKQYFTIGQGRPALNFPVAAFLYNCQVCLNRESQMSKYFAAQPPTLDEYLGA